MMNSSKKQSGAVLVLGLVMLLVLSVLVIAGSKSTMLQQKMTSNFRDKELAFQSAESAVRTGETMLRGLTKAQVRNIIFDGSVGYYNYDKTRVLKEESNWAALNTFQSQAGLHQVKETPVYIIENITGVQAPGGSLQVPKTVEASYFRVTAKGKGGTDASLSIIQTIYKK